MGNRLIEHYSPEFKQRAIEFCRKHGNKETCQKFRIPTSTLSGWMNPERREKEREQAREKRQAALTAASTQQDTELESLPYDDSASSTAVKDILHIIYRFCSDCMIYIDNYLAKSDEGGR
ncbi:MAG: hypothetical protein LBS74_02975 [Oscillospiraceae bacterium]|jgi:transposase-like protein|nr:hypothetical protein [Oscillospiraceae bacterium]